MYIKGSQDYDVVLSLEVVLILVNSVDPDEMHHYAAFYLVILCLLSTLIQRVNYSQLYSVDRGGSRGGLGGSLEPPLCPTFFYIL